MRESPTRRLCLPHPLRPAATMEWALSTRLVPVAWLFPFPIINRFPQRGEPGANSDWSPNQPHPSRCLRSHSHTPWHPDDAYTPMYIRTPCHFPLYMSSLRFIEYLLSSFCAFLCELHDG